MPNSHVLQRLSGIQTILNGVHQSGKSMSSASMGAERHAFIHDFLGNVLPTSYRFGTGDVTDVAGAKSGQLDVVVEHPFSPSLPGVGAGGTTRLYLAESVAAVIEVKSNISSQWAQAKATASKLRPLTRNFGATMVMGGGSPTPHIPMFVAAYTGWNSVSTVQSNLATTPEIDGVLVIDAGIFVSSAAFGSAIVTGPLALWGLICTLHGITNSLAAASPSPFDYAR